MPADPARSHMTRPQSVEEALRDLAMGGGAAVPVAGATWVMRAPLRHQPQAERFVALGGIESLQKLETTEDLASIGALVTHDRLARSLAGMPELLALRQAAERAANPGVRRIATIGGNLCAADFAASDFAPALLSLDASIEIADAHGSRLVSTESFLADRVTRERPWLLTRIVVSRNPCLTSHERLPMRRAGDYPCAIVSISCEVDGGNRIRHARIGVGAVEARARRWRSLETALEGSPLAAAPAEEAARDLLPDFTGRDDVDAPGWYRTSVLPVLVRRAFATILADRAEGAS